MINLFELVNKQVVPTVHCSTLNFLSVLQDEFPDDYLKIYQYLFYMCCADPDMNPFFHTPSVEKESMILEEIRATFSPEEDLIVKALIKTTKLYETETSRAYEGIKQALDNIATYMKNTEITDGKEGNIGQIRAMAKDFDAIRRSFKETFKDLKDEQSSKVRGGKQLAYDADE